jgi:EAL domain-containing protein (putative c-di-GMP-specific phosphodiesterase class I)
VRSVVELAKSLGLRVVAQGVDSQETADALASLGCAAGQGDLVGAPVPGDEVLTSFGKRAKKVRGAAASRRRRPPASELAAPAVA